MFKVPALPVELFLNKCEKEGILFGTGKVGIIRAVLHMDVSIEEAESAGK